MGVVEPGPDPVADPDRAAAGPPVAVGPGQWDLVGRVSVADEGLPDHVCQIGGLYFV